MNTDQQERIQVLVMHGTLRVGTAICWMVLAGALLISCGSEEGNTLTSGYPAGPEGAKALLESLLKEDSDRAALTAALRPRSEDYASAFAPEVAEAVEAGYAGLWDSGRPVVIEPKAGQTELRLWNATTEALRNKTGDADEFPGGYRSAAPHLKEGLTWYRFKFVEPGERLGMAYDGLVHVNGRWCWFPKPWRVLPKAP